MEKWEWFEEWAGLWRNRWVCCRLFLGVGDDNLMLFILRGAGGHGQDVNYLPMMSQFAR